MKSINSIKETKNRIIAIKNGNKNETRNSNENKIANEIIEFFFKQKKKVC